MEIMIREVVANDYTEVVFLWNDVLGIRNVNEENFRVTMEKMNKEGNYKTLVALFSNDVVGFVTIVQALSVGAPIGYLHIQALAVKREYQHSGVGTKLLRHTENYAKEIGISSIILCSGFKRTDAHAFYEHNGYDKDSYCFDKIINLA
ncbi:GCN5 family acetyltransferase [Paenibacillus helianthi]|uniref:GCN5 family acetyltransferase n=1 Tax=Paenibacillus helianthi TaxID=1349432 RepID=A0ABX3EU12_9BACL|nr:MULTISPECIES: GNAT family N-acetyltransferase [Paenibacillus]OKP81505.1 GCN5 family acetyltransferase [Paenibacillus sp. P3E]OKP91715.1 GCN5 family acetyltransferase [Paenibacillus helianthi]